MHTNAQPVSEEAAVTSFKDALMRNKEAAIVAVVKESSDMTKRSPNVKVYGLDKSKALIHETDEF